MRRALLSVSDKSGLVDFARALSALGFALIATGGTARALREAGLSPRDVSDVTGFPEILDGRVKTLHPHVHAGLLARRARAADMETLARLRIDPIDLVCVNLYPFEATVAREGVREEEALEKIDIGGPTLLRAAAKSWPDVIVVPDPRFYPEVLDHLRAGDVPPEARRRLAAEAFRATARYDGAIARWLGAARPLRYGENPHQRGWLEGEGPGELLSGKELSYTNLLDADAAIALVEDLPAGGAGGAAASACVIKHATPCGAAVAGSAADAFRAAYESDPLSAYGGVVGIAPAVDRKAALAMTEPSIFLECVIAPHFEPDAIETLTARPKWGKSVRLLRAAAPDRAPVLESRAIRGGLLVQERDRVRPAGETFEVRTRRAPTQSEAAALRLAIACAKHARSNAIAVAAPDRLLGIGAGQTSRVDAVRVALEKAGARARGAALASDAFFPFPDSIELAARAGITAIAEPGGARRDAEVIAAADAAGIALVFTGVRHFRH